MTGAAGFVARALTSRPPADGRHTGAHESTDYHRRVKWADTQRVENPRFGLVEGDVNDIDGGSDRCTGRRRRRVP